MSDVDEFLQTVPIFKDLDRSHRATLAKTIFSRSFNAGETILREGEPGVGVFMIRSGKVDVVKRSEQGEDHLNTLGPGDVFGEMALLNDTPRSATVRATEATELLGLTAWNFRAELQRSPDLAYQMLRIVSRRLAAADERLAQR